MTKLREYIITALSKNNLLRFSDLYKSVVADSDRKYTIQGVYKELRNLQEEGVIFKEGVHFGLKMSWIREYIVLADTLSQTYLNDRNYIPKLTSEKKKIWHFNNLLQMNDFWSHLLLLLLEQSKQKVLLGWNPHPWFHLVQSKKEEQYIKALKLARAKLYLIVGGHTFLDKWAEKYWDASTVEYSFQRSGFHSQRSIYFNVVDDYVLTVKLDSGAASMIDKIYDQTKSMDNLELSAIISLFNKKTKSTIWLEKNTNKAHKIRTKFANFWGRELE